MGNITGKLNLSPSCLCISDAGEISRRHDIAFVLNNNPLSDDGLGHSFCYIKPNHDSTSLASKVIPVDKTNTSSKLTSHVTSSSVGKDSCDTESEVCGSNLANDNLKPLFRSISGASISANATTALSTSLVLDSTSSSSFPFTIEPASSFSGSPSFASVPLQPIPRNNSFINSGPLLMNRFYGSSMGSGPVDRLFLSGPVERGFISGPLKLEKIKARYKPKKWGSMTSIRGIKDSILSVFSNDDNMRRSHNNNNLNDEFVYNNEINMRRSHENLQWAEGKAGEDRVHIVVSEDHGWAFVGIYDGFSGPDGPDFLLSNLYSNIHKELKGLLLCELESEELSVGTSNQSTISNNSSFDKNFCSWCDEQASELDSIIREKLSEMGKKSKELDVLNAFSNALRKTEEEYFDIADKMLMENPELSLMGSCVLVMLMIGEDVYVMNVGDSRAVLSQKATLVENGLIDDLGEVTSVQLTIDHNTNAKEEVQRIREEHPDDPSAILNDRVKGSLKVTRAFGAGFLKKPKWNDALLEMFQIDYIGTTPYLTSTPSLIHHKLGPKDKFLILSSDGLYQYMTNEEAVSKVDLFMSSTPEGDPAQHLIEEVLFRAAKKSGMDFYELLEIPQGERRRYHDDCSVIVISFQGRMWRSSV